MNKVSPGLGAKLVVHDNKSNPALVRRPEDCFILIPKEDLHAREALKAYANSCEKEDPKLAKEIWKYFNLG